MENREIPMISAQEGEHTILGRLNILVEGKDGLRSQNVLLVANDQKNASHPFRAIDERTEEEVKLTDTRLFDAYNALNLPIPAGLKKDVGSYYRIRIGKKRELIKKAANKQQH